jgi:SacI homology domain
MQGYFQVARFNIPPDPITHDEDISVEYTIVSRRSRYRAGLRYQRRGIDDDANVANFVETETIMRVEVLFKPLVMLVIADNLFAVAFGSRECFCLRPTSRVK